MTNKPMPAERLAEYLLECGHQTHFAKKDLAVRLITERDKARAALSATQGVDYDGENIGLELAATYLEIVFDQPTMADEIRNLIKKSPTAAPDAWQGVEPSQDMLEAARKVLWEKHDCQTSEEFLRDVFQAMIIAAPKANQPTNTGEKS